MFVGKLASDLATLGHTVWLDTWRISVGACIVQSVGEGVEDADFIVVVLSPNSTASQWVEREWSAKYLDEIARRRVLILPALLAPCTVPTLLRSKRYADFRKSYSVGLAQLAEALSPAPGLAGVRQFFSNIVNMDEVWKRLLNDTKEVDLLVMYAATWRNTYLSLLRAVLRGGGRLRVILPDPASDRLLQLYCLRLGTPVKELAKSIRAAATEFQALDGARRGKHVEVYYLSLYMAHSCYLFDRGGVLGLYSYQRQRVATPAFELVEGPLLDYLRDDFKYLVTSKMPRFCIPQPATRSRP